MTLNNKKNKGSSLYFAVAIITIILGVALGTSAILVTQIRIIREMGNSVLAIYAADTAIEKALYQIRKENVFPEDIDISGTLSNNSQYEINNVLSGGDEECDALNYCIKSIGKYQKVQRSIEIEF